MIPLLLAFCLPATASPGGPALQSGGGQETGTSPCRPLRQPVANYEFTEKEFSWQLKGRDLTFPSAVQGDVTENNTVWAKYWRPKDGEKRHAAVVLIHWLGGSFDTLELVAQRFADKGVAALMIWLPFYGKRRAGDERMITLSMEKTLRNFRQAVLDVRRAGDWLASRPEIDPGRIGILGISLGSIVGALAAGVDTNFTKAVLVIGGADLPGIVYHGSKETRELKDALEKAGFTADSLRDVWADIEPLTFAHRIAPGSVRMYNAEDDEIIPRAATMKLHEALGAPKITWFKGGHYAVTVQLSSILKDSAEFLKERPVYAPPLAPPKIRVLLAEDVEELSIEAGEVHVFKAGTDEKLHVFDKLGKTVIRRGVVGGKTFEGTILLVPAESGKLKIDKYHYHGSLLLVPAKTPKFHAINVLDLERYVMGVLGPEIGKDAPVEAQKAQAVCARTYAYVTLLERQKELFDVYADVRDQVYRGVPLQDVYVRAVEATREELLFYKDAPVKTYFSSTCGGRTESVFEWRKEKEIEPLAGGVCGFCDAAKWAKWAVKLTSAEIAKALKLPGISKLEVKAKTKTGRAKEIEITTTEGKEVAILATEFRATVGYDKFRSTNFTVAKSGDDWQFEGRGWGHGVGLCQEGAIGMALAGKGYREILKRYYPGTTLEKK